MTDSFLYTTPTDPVARPLIHQLTAEYDRRYGDFFGEPAETEMNRYPAELFAPPDGNFLLLLRDGVAIAGGAFKRFDATTAEVKRVWTDENHRRRGLSRVILAELEEQGRRQGYCRFYLTTGFRQPEAASLYLTSGYAALFDIHLDPELYGALAFEKFLYGPPPGYVPQVLPPPEGGWRAVVEAEAAKHA